MAKATQATQTQTVEQLIAALAAQGYSVDSIQQQKASKAFDGIKSDFNGLIEGFSAKVKDSGIRSILIKFNENNEFSIEYGTVIKTGHTSENSAAKPILYIKGESPIMSKGQWYIRLAADIKKVFKTKEESWLKQNRDEVIKGLIANMSDKYSLNPFPAEVSTGN